VAVDIDLKHVAAQWQAAAAKLTSHVLDQSRGNIREKPERAAFHREEQGVEQARRSPPEIGILDAGAAENCRRPRYLAAQAQIAETCPRVDAIAGQEGTAACRNAARWCGCAVAGGTERVLGVGDERRCVCRERCNYESGKKNCLLG